MIQVSRPTVETSLRYGVRGVYFDRPVTEGPARLLTIRIYPIPFVRITISFHKTDV